jgi:hypothetical protein
VPRTHAKAARPLAKLATGIEAVRAHLSDKGKVMLALGLAPKNRRRLA